MKKKRILYVLLGIFLISSSIGLYLGGFKLIGELISTPGTSNILCSKTFTITNASPIIESCTHENEADTNYTFSVDTSKIVSSDPNCTIKKDRDYKFFLGIDNKSFVDLANNPIKMIPSGLHTIDIQVMPHARRCPIDNSTFTVTGTVSIITTTKTFLLFDSGGDGGCGPANCNSDGCFEECETLYDVCYSVVARCENYKPGRYWYCWCDATLPV